MNNAFWQRWYAYVIAALAAVLILLWFVAPFYSHIGGSFSMFSFLRESWEFRELLAGELISFPVIFLVHSIIMLSLAFSKNAGFVPFHAAIGLGWVVFAHLIDGSDFGLGILRSPLTDVGLYIFAAYIIYAAQLILGIVALFFKKKNR